MAEDPSNAERGANAVDQLLSLLKSGDPALLYACDSVVRTIDRELPASFGVTVKKAYKVKGSLKSDLQVSFNGSDVTVAIAVISAGDFDERVRCRAGFDGGLDLCRRAGDDAGDIGRKRNGDGLVGDCDSQSL
jgi:hypothetical protein